MSILKSAENFTKQLFKDKLSSVYLYHNFNHTVFTVESVKKILDVSNLTEEEKEKVLVSAWFHDTGYVTNPENHEDKSCEIVRGFLQNEGKSEDYIVDVIRLIQSTKIGTKPNNFAEMALKDADCAHFGHPDYQDFADNLRQEWELTGFKTFTNREWNEVNLNLLKNIHTYYTDFAKENWQPVKEKNYKKIEKKLEKKDAEKNKVEDDKKDLKTDRSVDTMFRVTLNNHTRLSDIADSKANILLSVNAIIISVSLSVLFPKLDAPANAHLVLPTFILLIFSVITIIFVILSTRPKVTENRFSLQDVKDRKVNLLFFGNFNKLTYEDFLPSMRELLADKDYLYDTMIKDLYALGQVLDKKYKMLRIAYSIFMSGIIISVMAFIYAFIRI